MTQKESNDAPAARLQGLTKHFPTFELGPLDLTLERGTVVALVGPNGAGKTTTLNCMAGLVVPDAGTVEIFGETVGPNQTSYRRNLGYVGEGSGFFQRWTVDRNLDHLARLLPGWSSARAVQLTRRFGLPRDKAVRDLSTGNRAKLALVAALARGSRLLLLDEPTAGLDPVVRAEVLDVLWEVTEDGEHAVLYSTHVLSDISRLADELVFLRDGRVIQRSGREELAESWRRVSFRLPDQTVDLIGVVEHRRLQNDHQVITRSATATLELLSDLGAEGVETARMTIEEIAVQILKEGHDVASPAS
ncbi:MAG: ABC transporter ATP-binding protein [Thermoanaerobaculia bacterium]|nr:ABC transporter ATP-binding protein [Thermoanaerobaculia bacterium]